MVCLTVTLPKDGRNEENFFLSPVKVFLGFCVGQ
jgi:hypothetical protein